jgi:hypothetical protein
MRAVIIVAMLLSSDLTLAETLRFTTSFQGYKICDDGHGNKSTEWSRDGTRFGQDSDGNRWTTSRWQGIDTTTVTPER